MTPLPPPRSGSQPVTVIRALTAAQDKMAQGEEGASQQQKDLASTLGREMKAFAKETWKDPRNRQALIKYSLSGGSPDLLRTLIDQRAYPIGELPLAEGALAYALGHHAAAEAALDKIDVFHLAASLGGHIALIKAILAADSDPVKAAHLADVARLLSPGTLVEESALRMSIELAFRRDDTGGFRSAVSRYFRRFGKSPFAMAVLPQMAEFAAAHDLAADAKGKDWLAAISAMMAGHLRFEFYASLSGNALRRGQIETTIHGAENAAKQPDADAAGKAMVLAYEGAARVVSRDPRAGLRALALSERSLAEPAVAELISVSRLLAGIITAPPHASIPDSTRPAASVKAAEMRKAIAGIDKLLQDTAR